MLPTTEPAFALPPALPLRSPCAVLIPYVGSRLHLLPSAPPTQQLLFSSSLCSVTEFFILHTSALEVFPRLPRTPFSSSASSVGYDGYVDVLLGSLRPGTVLPYLSSSRIFHPSLADRTWSSTASRSIPTNVWGLKPRTTTSFARSSAVPSTSTGLQCLDIARTQSPRSASPPPSLPTCDARRRFAYGD